MSEFLCIIIVDLVNTDQGVNKKSSFKQHHKYVEGPFARARVAELEAHIPPGAAAAWFDFGRRALVLSRALIAVVAAPTKKVAANLIGGNGVQHV